MWHEARKQEKKIRGLLVDYKKRAERRKEYYERIKQDPTQFIQIHGRSCKIHLDPSVHHAAEAPGSMLPWRGDNDCIIDRFDVRAHLDDISPFNPLSTTITKEEMWEERQVNYERYRILVQNEFLDIKEEKFLHQIRVEELYGPINNKAVEEEKKLLAPKKAAISFSYEEAGGEDGIVTENLTGLSTGQDEKEDDSDDSDSALDLDLTVDVLQLNSTQHIELNVCGLEYGLQGEDFMALMQKDIEEADALRIAKEHEDEKAMYSGRKSRKERRALKKKHLERKTSPPSYAARSSPTYAPYLGLACMSPSKSHSRSPSPITTTQIKYITSFGGDSDAGASSDEKKSTKRSEAGRHETYSNRKYVDSSRRDQYHSRRKSHQEHSKLFSSFSPTHSGKQYSSSRRRRSRSRSSSHHNSNRKSYESFRYSHSRSPSGGGHHRSYTMRGGSVRQTHDPSPSRSSSFTSRSRSPDRKSRRTNDKYSTHKESAHGNYHPASQSRTFKDSVPKPGKCTSGSLNPHLKPPSPPRQRYYGRRGADTDSEEETETNTPAEPHKIDFISDAVQPKNSSSVPSYSSYGSESSADKGYAATKITHKERLRKKMQVLLKKQYKADKKVEKEKAVKAEQERQDREDELRGIAIKLRRREREKRHRRHDESESDDSRYSRSPSPRSQKYNF